MKWRQRKAKIDRIDNTFMMFIATDYLMQALLKQITAIYDTKIKSKPFNLYDLWFMNISQILQR